MDSIIQTEKECFFCGRTEGLDSHHIFGAANRKWSEKYGLKIWLCPAHHTLSNDAVHLNPATLGLQLKQMGQRKFEEAHTREDFMRIFGRNYL